MPMNFNGNNSGDDYDPFDYPPGANNTNERASTENGEHSKNGGVFPGYDDPFDLPPGDGRGFTPPRLNLIEFGAPPTVDSEREAAISKKRKTAATVYLIGIIACTVMGLAFFFTPFMSITAVTQSGEKIKIYQYGFSLIGTLFGGDSPLSAACVQSILVREAGYCYLVYIVMSAMMIVNAVIVYGNYNEGGQRIMLPAVVNGLSGLFIWVFSAVGMDSVVFSPSVVAESARVYVGGMGVGSAAILSLAVSLTSSILFSRCPSSRFKKRHTAYGAIATAAVIALLLVQVVPLLYGNRSDVYAVSPSGSGYAVLDIEEYDDSYFGVSVIKFDDLEAGETYRFFIKTDDDIDGEFLSDALMCCRFSDVESGDAYERLVAARPISYNETRGDSTATVTFTYDGGEDLAAVFSLAASGRMTLGFTYTFEKVG